MPGSHGNGGVVELGCTVGRRGWQGSNSNSSPSTGRRDRTAHASWMVRSVPQYRSNLGYGTNKGGIGMTREQRRPERGKRERGSGTNGRLHSNRCAVSSEGTSGGGKSIARVTMQRKRRGDGERKIGMRCCRDAEEY